MSENGLLHPSRADGEAIARAVFDAIHGRGAFDELAYLERDAAIDAAMDTAAEQGLGAVPW
jgi:hypothetical protein